MSIANPARGAIPAPGCSAFDSAAVLRGADLPPLTLYVHFPWCVRKCPYCDFNSHELRGSVPEAAYLEALIEDLETSLPTLWGRPIVSVFIGGGTPSLLSPAGVDRLLSAVRARVRLAPGAEITLEANPGTLDEARCAGFRAAGVNRLSLGVQSFSPRSLAALGRIHDEREGRAALDMVLERFERVNVDLMYALPEQSLADVRRDVEIAIGAGAGHISAYSLTIEPNTAFAAQPPELPDEELAAEMQALLESLLVGASFERYEVSAFARPGERCAHNLNYWHFGDYLGIGAGAHGKRSSPSGIVRETRPRHPARYLARVASGDFRQDVRRIDEQDLPFEFMMNAMRLTGGFDPGLFPRRTGLPLAAIEPILERAGARGLIEVRPGCIAPTPLGLRFLNDLLQEFLPAPAA